MPSYNYPYAPQYYPQPNYNVQMPMQTQNRQSQNASQIEDGGFVSIPNEEMVYSYPVAIGKCVTFKVEGKPIIIEKSMGFSQFEAPKIRRFRLVEEEAQKEEALKVELSDLDKVKSDIAEIWGKLDEIESSRKKNQSQPQQKNDRNGEH